MVAMKNLDRLLARLKDRLAPTDLARDPRQRLRVGGRLAWTDF
jgi:hypothetical protein